MPYMDILLIHYGWEGLTLMALLFAMFCVQLHYYLFVYSRIPSYKNTLRRTILDAEPPVSVIIPIFSENYTFVEERLPLIVAQEYRDFEVILVYVGSNNDFYEDLVQLKLTFPQINVTKIHLNPRYPISRKMALNVGIKSAHNDYLIFSTTETMPQCDRWLSLMAKGFCKGDVVLGYCGIEQERGFWNYIIRTWRMMHAADWLARAVRQRPYRGTLYNLGFTKKIYFDANGFNHLNMNIGEDDLFMQKVMTRDNVSVILSPRASLRERPWGGFRGWLDNERYYGSAEEFYPTEIKNFIRWELGSRLLFFLLTFSALIFLPGELKIVAGTLLLVRYLFVALEVRRLAQRLGEKGIVNYYFLYDFLSPLLAMLLAFVLLRKDERVWR
ncbi:MAG: glycosyltransferase [Alistipes sp.]